MKPSVVILLCCVILLAAYLRCTGLSWGLESGFGRTLNYHPDEFISLRGVLQIDFKQAKLKVPGAYFEGTFNYYLWALPLAVRDLLSSSKHDFDQLNNPADFRFALLSGRIMSVFFDLAALLFVYLAIIEITQSEVAALAGAFHYAILPMQVIYAHFMRTHLLSNFLCSIVLWLSFRLRARQSSWLFFVVGLLSGLALATRYPVAIIVFIPCLVLLFDSCGSKAGWKLGLVEFVTKFLRGPGWLIALGFATGAFVGDPMLFLDSRAVIDAIVHQTLQYVPVTATRPSDFIPLWKYLSVLIPYAAYPLLWITAYGAVIYLCFRRSLYQVTMPLLLFVLLYSYPMAKGYLVTIARQVMLILPVFCMLIGIALADLRRILGKRRMACNGLLALLFLLSIPSLTFDFAYVFALDREDVRTSLRHDLAKELGDAPGIIAVGKAAGYFYATMPGVVPLSNEKVTVQLQEPAKPATYFALGSERPFRPDRIEWVARSIERTSHFRLKKVYDRAPTVFGKELDLSSFPPDMTYPFVTILLFRSSRL